MAKNQWEKKGKKIEIQKCSQEMKAIKMKGRNGKEKMPKNANYLSVPITFSLAMQHNRI